MDDNRLIDFPQFRPKDKATFPPTGPATDERDRENAEKRVREAQKPYDAKYPASYPATDPSLTTPGGKNLYDPDTRLTVEEVKAYNPDVDWKD